MSYVEDLFGLTGKTAVVIGGTGVLGGAFCEALGGAGAHVCVVGRNQEHGDACVARIQKLGGTAEFFAADSTKREDLDAIVTQLRAEDRNADVVVNGAGINSATPFLEITDEEWERILNVNLRGVRLGCQVFGQYMLDR
ncbi:MAG: SDR family NAD(P)-dependent oxidoreductase, partial [Planctomycetota bacterium]|nr:SDR family NAD(P)-dependent oxidoreductase [Planctomycetota bacterium]